MRHTGQLAPKPPAAWTGFDPDGAAPAMAWRLGGEFQVRRLPDPGSVLSGHDRCVASMPSRFCLYRAISPPPIGGRRLKRLLPGMLDMELPFAIEECETRFFLVPGETSRVLALAVRQVDIEARLAELEQQGCDPRQLLPEPWVAWRYALADRRFAAPGGLCVLGLLRRDEHTFIAGRDGRMTDCLTGPAGDGGRLLRHLLGEHDHGQSPPVRFMTVALDEVPPEAAENLARMAGDRVEVLAAGQPMGWLPRALAACPGSAAWGLNLRRSFKPHRREELGSRAAPGRVSVSFAAAAAMVFLSANISVRRMESVAGRARDGLQEEINSLAGYVVTRRGRDAVKVAGEALEERMQPELAGRLRPPALHTLRLLLETARDTGVDLHDVSFAGAEWVVRASAGKAGDASQLARELERRGKTFRVSYAGDRTGSPVEFLLLSGADT